MKKDDWLYAVKYPDCYGCDGEGYATIFETEDEAYAFLQTHGTDEDQKAANVVRLRMQVLAIDAKKGLQK